MTGIGEAMRWIGFGVAALGIAGMAAGIVLQVVGFVRRHEVDRRATVLVFRSGLLAPIGLQIVVLGLILTGDLAWPWLFSIVLVGLPAVVALIEFPRPS